jgi:hypothetical protein
MPHSLCGPRLALVRINGTQSADLAAVAVAFLLIDELFLACRL